MLIAFSFVLSTVSVFAFNSLYQAEIDEDIPLEEGGVHRVMVKVNWNPDLEPIKFNHDAVVAELKAEAAETQAPILAYLSEKRDATVLNTFWLTNLIMVEADTTTIREMATFTGVSKILTVFNLTIPANEMGSIGDFSATSSTTWNIEKVRAPEVWEELGITGEGIRFATSDSGIELGHPDLAGTLYSDDYSDPTYPGGWIEFDSAGNIVPGSVPHDTYGHGTATYGVMVGDAMGPFGAVGMAPGAAGLGMHALNLPGGSGTFPQVVAGLQWIIDPFDQYGNPAGAPARVSSHSWGATGYYDDMIDPIRNMWYSGHFVCAAIGNDYEGASSSPGNVYETMSAGMTDSADYVDPQSGGEWVYKTDWISPPDDWPEQWIKPEVCAPGVDVIVPYPPDTYVYWGGTSFSSPHTGGAAVLMLSGNPSLTPPELQEALQETAVWYDRYYPERPDTRYGWGRIDAYEAVMMVALPQGVRGYVTDVDTGEPLSQVKVYAIEADRSVFTDDSGYYDMRLVPGTYTVTFSRFGYYEETFPGVVVEPDVFTYLDVALELAPPGFVEGHVYFLPNSIGIPGATVEVLDVPITVEAETDAMGYYHLALPPGTYDLEASVYGFSSDLEEGVVVTVGDTTTVDFYLEQPAKIAIVDYYGYGSAIKDFLTAEGYTVDVYSTIPAILPYITEYGCIIANNFGYIYSSDLMDFIDATDANGIGVLWLDSWSSYCGAYWLNRYLGWPPSRYTYYSSSIDHLYYRVTQTDDDIIPGFAVDDKIVHDYLGYFKDHAYYRGVVEGDVSGIGTVKTLTNVGYNMYGSDYDYYDSQGIIKVDRTDNKWVVLSMHANTAYTDITYWHDDSKTVFLNSINWVAKPHVGIAKFVPFGLDVDPEVGLWYEDRTVSVGIKNVGWITGTDTVELHVDGVLEGSATFTLAPGEYDYVSWSVSRFDVGTYTARVKYLTTTFTVRPPEITLKAYEYDKNKPLAGAEVYGFYRKYTGPGYFEQWSETYGGNGHSQLAQPVGDIDEDGVNEIIVGGYETEGMARIKSYDANLGTYIEEYNWYVPGGTYHSPSGSTVLDLDEDGDLEFVVSWTYSGADGIYAYDWDGTTLTELDYYACGFVFDVYSCDYDDDGDVEVLIANAPWGGTPWHVMAFRWEAGAFVEEAAWLLPGYSYMECPMIWSGDIDNDGKTEVVAVLSDSYYSTAGTWALNWNSGTGEWEEELVYADLIGGGTHYGVVVGDVDGDGTPEIGVGNNNAGYMGAAAVLLEWNGVEYELVWEGNWPDEEPIIEALDIGDADNDGENEFIAGGGNVHVIGWTGTNYAEEATITETSGLLAGSIIGDMDSDGFNEIKACSIITGPGKEWIFDYTASPIPIDVWYFDYFGTTDQNGELVFDAPASVFDMFLFVYKPDKTPLGWQYLLTKFDTWWTDGTVVYEPTSTTEAVVISRANARALEMFEHLGVTWLQYDYIPIIWPFTSVKADPATIVVSPQFYAFYHMLNVIDPYGSWWYYFMAPDRTATLFGGDTYEYSFGGTIQAYVEHTKTDADVLINWNAWDSFGHQITGITHEEVSWLASGTATYVPAPIEPSMLEDVKALVAETIEIYPLITLYHNKKDMIASGFVQWYEKPAYTTVTKDVAYATLSFTAGPYGNPNARMYVYIVKEP